MKYEPLRGKLINARCPIDNYCMMWDDIKHFKFEDVKSAAEFYKRYSFDEGFKLLRIEEPKVLNLFSKWFMHNHPYERYDAYYTVWLFNYCFEDVIK